MCQICFDVVHAASFPISNQCKLRITADNYFSRAVVKILSGAANAATGWLELPKNIVIWRQKEKNTFVVLLKEC